MLGNIGLSGVFLERPREFQTVGRCPQRDATYPVPMSARVVVVGGGITGCSVAYHLALAGWDDVVVLEKGELTSGSTHHAAGLVTMFNPSATMMEFRRYSVSLYNELDVFNAVGSVRMASSPDSLRDLQRAVSRARGVGLDARLLGPDEVVERMPFASRASLYGGVWMAGDGHVDPHICHARRRRRCPRARRRVPHPDPCDGDRARAQPRGPCRPHRGRENRDRPCGQRRRGVGTSGCRDGRRPPPVGAGRPSARPDAGGSRGRGVPRRSPCFRDTDNLVYGKDEAGGMLIGGYEQNPTSRWSDGVPWDHGASPVQSDMDRFAPLLEGAIRRFPFLDRSGVIRLLCHPDAMTPDGNPLLGPMPGIPGFWVAAGLSLNGFGGAGGIGRALAEWMTEGEPSLDVTAYRAWRFGAAYLDSWFATACAREAYRYYYRLRYPFDTDEWGRGLRSASPLQVRLQELGAAFGTKNGWERADHFEPGNRWRRSGADQRQFGWTRPPWFDLVRAEHEGFRERVGIIDMTSFGKLDVRGPGALELLDRVCDSRIDRPVGSVIYTQFLNGRGGIVADLTVTRLGEERFRVITGTATAVDGDRGWLELCRRSEDGAVEIRDCSDELAVIGIWGPRARAVLAACTGDGVSRWGRSRSAAPDRSIYRVRPCSRRGSLSSASSATSSTSSPVGQCRCGTG